MYSPIQYENKTQEGKYKKRLRSVAYIVFSRRSLNSQRHFDLSFVDKN